MIHEKLTTLFLCSIMVFSGVAIIGTSGDCSGTDDETFSSPGAVHSGTEKILTIDDVTQRQQGIECDHRNSLVYNGTLFLIYSWFNGSTTTVSVLASYDMGGNWTSKVDIWSSSTFDDSHYNELLFWKGDIYAFFSGFTTARLTRQIFMKKASIGSWQNLKTSNLVSVRTTEANSWVVTHDDDYIYMAMVQASQWKALFYRYNGNSWSGPTSISGSGETYHVSISALKTSSGTKLLYIYCRPYLATWSTGYMYLRTSTNNGASWTSARAIMNDYTDYFNNHITNINGTMMALSSRYNNDEIQVTISRDEGSTWTTEKTIIDNRGTTTEYPQNPGFSMGIRAGGRIICLVFENQDEQVKMIYSKDWGSNWIDEDDAIVIQSSQSFRPVLSNGTEFVSYIVKNGTEFNVEMMDIRDLYLDDYAPRNLTLDRSLLHMNLSWDPPPDSVFSRYEIENYTIYRGTSWNTLSYYQKVGNVTWFNDTILSLEDATYYYFVTSTFKTLGESTVSNLVSGDVILPPPIEGFKAVGADLHVKLSWLTFPSYIGSSFDVTHFTISRGRYWDAMHPYFRIDPAMVNFDDFTISNEPNSYHYKISYHLSGYGDVGWSTPATAQPFTMPEPPADPFFTNIDEGVLIQWELPQDNGRYSVVNYSVYRGHTPEDLDLVQIMDAPIRRYEDLNLTTGEKYFYRISASNKLGSGGLTEPILVHYRSTSSSPRSLGAVGMDGIIEISWVPPMVDWGLEIEEYNIYRAIPGEEMDLFTLVIGSKEQFSDPVTNGIEYSYWISSVNRFGESEKAGPVHATASSIPGQMTGMSVIQSDEMVKLQWDPDVPDGGSPVIGYNIYRSETMTSPEMIGTIPSRTVGYTDHNLVNGMNYYYWISPLNKNGEGPLTGPISAVPGSDPDTISRIDVKSMLFSNKIWWPNPGDGGSSIQSYNVYRGLSVHSLDLLDTVAYDQTQQGQFMDEEVEYGHTYYYAVSATNIWGESPLSPIVPVSPSGVPSEPELYLVESNRESFKAYWNTPTDDGRSPVIGYLCSYREIANVLWTGIETTMNSLMIDGLDAGRAYEVKVVAFSQLGDGVSSEIQTVKLGDVPGKVTKVEMVTSDGAATLSWTQPYNGGFSLLGYNIYMQNDMGVKVLIRNVGSDTNEITITGLENGVQYSFLIGSFNEIGNGPLSDPVGGVPLSFPSHVSDLWVTEAAQGNIVLHWNPPTISGGTDVEVYNIYRGTVKGEEEILADDIPGRQTHYRDDSVIDGTEYFYRISARTEVGEGPRGISLGVTPYGTPATVGELSIDATTDTVDLKWLPPVDDGGKPVTGYLVYKGTGPVDMKLWRVLGSNTLKVSDENVREGTYHYNVIPINDIGSGEGSDVMVEVPSRTIGAVIIGAMSFLIPLFIAMLIIFVPFVIRKSKKKEEEKTPEKKIEGSQSGIPPTIPGPPGPGLPGSFQDQIANRPVLPGLQTQHRSPGTINSLPPVKPATMQVTGDGYMRPVSQRPVARNKDQILRQNGMTPGAHLNFTKPPSQPGPGPANSVGPSTGMNPAMTDPSGRMEKLMDLKEMGIISEEEFNERKRDLTESSKVD